jgi:hypothetical protein
MSLDSIETIWLAFGLVTTASPFLPAMQFDQAIVFQQTQSLADN